MELQKPFAYGFTVFLLLFHLTGIILVLRRRRRQHFHQRQVTLICVLVAGWILHAITGPGEGAFYNLCTLSLFGTYFVYFLVFPPLLINLHHFYQKTRYAELAQAATLDEIKRAQMQFLGDNKSISTGGGDLSSRLSFNPILGFNRLSNKSSVSGAFVTISGTYHGKSSSVGSETQDESAEELSRARYLQSERFATSVLLVFCVLGFVVSIVRVAAGRIANCGQPGIDYDFLALFVLWFIFLGNYAYQYLKLKSYKKPDPYGILLEARFNLFAVAVIVVAYFLAFLDVFGFRADANKSGLTNSSYQYLVALGGLFLVYNLTYEQIYVSNKTTKLREDMTIDEILEDPNGRMFLERFLVTELSLENLKFYTEAMQWRENYDKSATESVRSKAFEIFKLFISKNQAFLEINIPHQMRQQIYETFYGKGDGVVPKTIFDGAIAEVRRLLEQSFPRFLESVQYRQYLGLSVDKALPEPTNLQELVKYAENGAVDA